MASYTSPERVERNGFLVAFKGETMTETEARKRGLLGANSITPAAGQPASDDNNGNTLSKAEVKAELESRGIKYNNRTSEKKLRELLDDALAAETAGAEKAKGTPANDVNGEGENPETANDANGEGENPETANDANGEGENPETANDVNGEGESN